MIVPIIGKFSSGKSTLLNRYLGENYLKIDIAPETAIATELCYAEEEHLFIHYLDGSTPTQQDLNSLDSLVIDERMAFIQIFLNNATLKKHENIILVDMPGFDARNQAHHKAIACYLERGDYFISLMPIDIPFDHSIIERLAEIYFDYGKQVSCLLSKAARKPVAQREENNQIKSPICFNDFINACFNPARGDFCGLCWRDCINGTRVVHHTPEKPLALRIHV